MLQILKNEAPRSLLRGIFSARKIIHIRRFSSVQQAARYSSGKADKLNNQGFGVIELLVAVSIIIVALVFIMGIYSFFLKAGAQNAKRLQAVALAQEVIEATRSVRDENWNNIANLSIGTTYYPAQSGSPAKWILSVGQQTINGFTRQVVLSRVYRDANDNIIESGGTEDLGTRKITATVLWQERGKNYSVDLATYLTNWR